jgi:hypothetical protein
MIYGRYRKAVGGDGLDCEFLVSHEVGGGLQLPINIMLVTADGDAYRMVINTSGEARVIH